VSEPAADADESGGLLLPEPVRQRLVALTLEVLESLGEERLPASVRPLLRFAPQRRARLAAGPIGTALHDDDFRSRVASRLRPARGELVDALERGEPVADDPVEVAAVAYLLRPDGWRQTLADAVGRIDGETQAGAPREEELERLRQQVDEARAELTDVRGRLRQQVSQLKADNAELRRKLGTERSRTKQATEEAERLRAAEQVARDDAESRVAAAQSEVRRLRARIDELSDDAKRSRQSDRAERGGEAMRARLLLDALLSAAQGLRRELALPPVETLPADLSAPDDERPVAAAGGRAQDPADPALLEQLLAVPRVHLLVDGYNVTKLEWGTLSLEEQRVRLLRELAPVAARSGAEVTVVFDGADLEHRPAVAPPRGVRVRFSPAGVTADEVVRDLVRAEPEGRAVVVVSSDQEVAGFAARSGARAIPAVALVRLLGRG
jgi:predicted RNA-binding protein with PIN domain